MARVSVGVGARRVHLMVAEVAGRKLDASGGWMHQVVFLERALVHRSGYLSIRLVQRTNDAI